MEYRGWDSGGGVASNRFPTSDNLRKYYFGELDSKCLTYKILFQPIYLNFSDILRPSTGPMSP